MDSTRLKKQHSDLNTHNLLSPPPSLSLSLADRKKVWQNDGRDEAK